MKTIFRKINEYFYRLPIFTTLIVNFIGASFCTVIIWIINIIKNSSSLTFSEVILTQMAYFLMLLPIVLTIQNIIFLLIKSQREDQERAIKWWEVFAIVTGGIFSFFFLAISEIIFEDWYVPLYNSQKHTPIAIESLSTIGIIALLAIGGYIILRFFPIVKLPPLFAVFCISALYLGILECILWCVQIFNTSDTAMLLLCLFPFNCILIAIRTIKNIVYQQTCKKQPVSPKFKHIVILLNNTANWPWIAFITAIPLLGILVVVLLLFGQEPDSFIKAWTQTADWNMSHKIAPKNLPKDGHYLCTVAAAGHPRVVKPIRTGKRHGHSVLVNRQLCIANAFEQLLEEQVPGFHRFVRALYDQTGYPIAKHIHSPYVADAIYFLMKPLEWTFLLFLYLFDVNPENRIAIQYPHSMAPTLK